MDRRRERRLFVDIPGHYTVPGAPPQHMFLSQISVGGCRISEAESPLEPGQAITVHLGQMGPIPAEVRWRDDTHVGVAFITPLDAAIVDFFAAYCRGGD